MRVGRKIPPSTSVAANARFNISSVLELSRTLNAALDFESASDKILLTFMGRTVASQCAVLIRIAPHKFRLLSLKGLSREFLNRTFTISSSARRLSHTLPPEISCLIDKSNSERLFLPLQTQGTVYGFVLLAGGCLSVPISADQRSLLQALASIAATSLEKLFMVEQLGQVNRRLDGKLQENRTLFELSKEFGQTLEHDRLVRLLAFAIMGQMGVQRYLIWLDQGGKIPIVGSRLDCSIEPSVVRLFGKLNRPMVVNRIPSKVLQPLRKGLEDSGVAVIIPMQIRGKTRGVFGVGRRMNGESFTPADLEFLYSLGSLAIISLENARLFREALEKQKMEDELLIAHDIQRRLLPSQLPQFDEFSLVATNISSQQVGGDYYDVISLSKSEHLIVIADVSGKGTPASLLMANLQAAIRALAPLRLPLGELISRVNNLICENTSPDRFITLFCGILDVNASRLTYVNAGHNPPFLFRAKGLPIRLKKGGMILGVFPAESPYKEGIVSLRPGDLLVCFTDGISEAMNLQGQEFTEKRLKTVVSRLKEEPVDAIVQGIGKAIQAHTIGAPQSDDITLLVIKRRDIVREVK